MCELFGVCAAEPFRVNDLLDAFFHHSTEHKDGWGLAVFRGRGASLEKEPLRAIDSAYLQQRLSKDVMGSNLFAHIRMATIGRIEYANCHPFIWDDDSGRTWTLIHNGTVFEGATIAPYIDAQEGTTDSERILLRIVDRMNEEIAKAEHAATDDSAHILEALNLHCQGSLQCPSGFLCPGGPLAHSRSLPPEARFQIVNDIICQLAEGNKLNLLLYDGEYMYVHTNCRKTLHVWRGEGRRIFSTRPVVTDGWEELPMNQLMVYFNGYLVYEGTNHGCEFLEEACDYTSLLAAYAEL